MIPWSAYVIFIFPKAFIESKGIARRYINDGEFRTNIKIITALAFLPLNDTIPSFHALAIHSVDEKQPFSD